MSENHRPWIKINFIYFTFVDKNKHRLLHVTRWITLLPLLINYMNFMWWNQVSIFSYRFMASKFSPKWNKSIVEIQCIGIKLYVLNRLIIISYVGIVPPPPPRKPPKHFIFQICCLRFTEIRNTNFHIPLYIHPSCLCLYLI